MIYHRQDFAGGDIQNDDRARARTLVANRRLQLTVGEVLNAQVDGEYEVATGTSGANALDVLHYATVAVLNDALGAVLARQPVVERQLQSFLTGIVDVRESENVPGDFTCGVVASVFARGVNAGNAERLDLGGLVRLTTAGDIQELAIKIARDAASQILAVELQRRGQTWNLVRRQRQFFRIHPDGIHRCADSKRLAEAIRNRAAVSSDLSYSGKSSVTFLS